MEQLVTPNINIPYVGGLCEGYVEGMCGQATIPTRNNQITYGVYGNAVSPVNAGETAKWDWNPGNGNHPGEMPPMGVMVPLYFTLGSTPAGHTALWLGDGRVISSSLPGFHKSGYIHESIQALIDFYAPSNGGCKYLGYSTYVGNIKIVGEEKMDKIASYEFCANASQFLLGRKEPVTIDWYNNSTEKNMTESQVYNIWANSQEAKDFRWKGWDYDKLLDENKQLKEKSDFVKVSDLYIKK